MIDQNTILATITSTPLISFAWESIKSGVAYDIIKNISEKTLNILLKHKEQNNINSFSDVLETAMEMNPTLKSALEKGMNNSIMQTGDSNQAINNQTMSHSGSGHNIGIQNINNNYATQEQDPKY